MHSSILDYATRIGANPLMTQGSGGNISWKEGNDLWVKRSGVRLAEAQTHDCFLHLNLAKTRQFIAIDNYDFSGAVEEEALLQPSIETALHALLPQRIILHVHAVDVLAHAVKQQAQQELMQKLSGLDWLWIDYATPGRDLAQAVLVSLSQKTAPDILVLGNHGLVVCGDSIESVEALINDILTRLLLISRPAVEPDPHKLSSLKERWQSFGYRLPDNNDLHTLALDSGCSSLAGKCWPLYPDHVVFLGAQPPFFTQGEDPNTFFSRYTTKPPFVIAANEGIIINQEITLNQQAMLACYLAVTLRLENPNDVHPLSEAQVTALLAMDQEKYRQKITA